MNEYKHQPHGQRGAFLYEVLTDSTCYTLIQLPSLPKRGGRGVSLSNIL